MRLLLLLSLLPFCDPSFGLQNNKEQSEAGNLLQGDILLTEEQLKILSTSMSGKRLSGTRQKRQAPTFAKKWINNTVNFYFDASINERKRASIRASHDYIQSRTCINFVESNTSFNRFKIVNGSYQSVSGCHSNLGMIGGEQELSIGEGCESMGIVTHEFMHALGFFHTHCRSDRDNYVVVHSDSIKEHLLGQFFKYDPTQNYLYTPYEYAGVLHYGVNRYNEKPDITAKDNRYDYTMGGRIITFYDMEMINLHYECHEACKNQNSAKCENGGVPNPRNCSVCNCPRGYGGDFCDQRPTGCGETLTATEEWQQTEFGMGVKDRSGRDVFDICNHWITAPKGKQVEVKVTYLFNTRCESGCPLAGIEIKTEEDPRITSPSNFTWEYRFVDGAVKPVEITPGSTTSTTAPVHQKTRECKDMREIYEIDTCEDLKADGFCEDEENFQYVKYQCGKTCGLCGIAAPLCKDVMSSQCASIVKNNGCGAMDPMLSEYYCAKSCGFCDDPN